MTLVILLGNMLCVVCRRVAAFVDIEAEASDDDDGEEDSGDDPDAEEEEGTEADAMFVNDASPASVRSQPERGSAMVGGWWSHVVTIISFCWI